MITSFVLDDGTSQEKLYMAGGYNNQLYGGDITDNADLYDPDTDTFRFHTHLIARSKKLCVVYDC